MHTNRISIFIVIYCFSLLITAGSFAAVKYQKGSELPVSAEVPTPTREALLNLSGTPTPTPTPTVTPAPSATETPAPTEALVKSAWEELRQPVSQEWKDMIGNRCIILKKPEAYSAEKEVQITLTDLAVDRSIRLVIENCVETALTVSDIERISQEEYFNSTPPSATPTPTITQAPGANAAQEATQAPGADDISQEATQAPGADDISQEATQVPGEADTSARTDADASVITQNTGGRELKNDPLRDLSVSCQQQADGSCTITADLLLDKTYCYYLYETEDYYYISLVNAKEVYKKIVVLDAGHGGWDNGTSSEDGRYREKDMNLSVLLYLKEYLQQEKDITVYCTRTTDRRLTLDQRIELANSLEADFFISIHCNNAYNNPQPNGTEVLYSEFQNKWEGVNSKKLAQICLEEMLSALQLKDRGLFPRGTNLTVLNKAEVPCALVEVGFMSNKGDLAVIIEEENQRKAAEAIYRAILRAYELKE